MFHYFVIGILFSRLFITEPVKQYEYLCAPHQRTILTAKEPICLYNCNKGYVRLRIDGYDNNIYYYIDKHIISMKEAVSYYYNILNQDTMLISVNNRVTSLLERPAFGYFIVTNGTETNLYVPFKKNVEYKDIKLLFKTRKILDLYYPACVDFNTTKIPITFKREINFFKQRYIVDYNKIHNISKLFATLSNKVEKNITYGR